LIISQNTNNSDSLKIEAEDNILERIETEVKDGTLVIKYKKNIWCL
jgi:hypothetical protein